MKLKHFSILILASLLLQASYSFVLGDGSCSGYENKLYAYDFNETPSGDWGYVEKLAEQNVDYNVEIVNSSYHPDINGTALHFNASSTGANGGILFSYSLDNQEHNLSLGFPVTTIEFDFYNVTINGMVDWADLYIVIRQNNWTEGTTIEYSFDGIPTYYSNGDHFHAILNSINHNVEARGYDCSKYWTGNGTQIESYVDWTCPYEIDTEMSSFYLAFENNGDDDFLVDFVIDNLVVSQYENMFNSPVDCMGKQGFPYVHGYALHNQADQGFTNAIWENGVPVAYYRCQQGMDNQFWLESHYDENFIPAQVEYSSRNDIKTDYPEHSIIWYDVDENGKKTYHSKAYFTFRSDILFLGDYDGCIDVHDLCQEKLYKVRESERTQYNDGFIYNQTQYNPVHSNKTPTYVCGINDTYDNRETCDVVAKTDNSFRFEPYPFERKNLGDFRAEWIPYRDYDYVYDSIHPNLSAFLEDRVLNNESGLCGYFADMGVTPCPYQTFEDYFYCNARWIVDEPFLIDTFHHYHNNNSETVEVWTNQSLYLDPIVAWTNHTWFNDSYVLGYKEFWNTTIPNYFNFSLCRYDSFDYLPFGSMESGTIDGMFQGYGYDNYSIGVGNGLNKYEGAYAFTLSLFNNLTIDKQDYYIVEEHPYKYVYKFVEELDPILELVKYVSIQVPIETNVSDWNKFRYYDSSGDELSFTKEGSTYNLLEDVSESHSTWTNSPENFTVEFTVCKEGMYYDELTEDCYNSPTFFTVMIQRTTYPLITGLISIVLVAGIVLYFKKEADK